MKLELDSLIDKKTFPAISIILPLHPQFPEIKIDSEHLISIFKNIEQQLNDRYGIDKSKTMLQKVKDTFSNIPANHLSKSLLIYISPEINKIISLPFSVTEKVIIDSSFEIRDLIYAAQKNINYLLVIISRKSVKTFYGDLFRLTSLEFPEMPDNIDDVLNEHSFPGLDYLDSKAFDEKNLHTYLRFIDEVLEKSLKQNEMPVVIMGNVKILGYFKQYTRNTKRIIGFLDGNFEHISLPEIKNKVSPIVENKLKEEEIKAIAGLNDAVNENKCSSGITEVWRSANEGKGRMLLVEKDYSVRARRGPDKYTIFPDESIINPHNVLSDAVDDVIEIVLRNGGNVIFVDNNSLSAYDHIALINRY